MEYSERYLAVVGLGSNLKGDLNSVDAQLVRAARALSSEAGTVVACSPIYSTPPWGVVEQAEFRNAVVLIATDSQPLDFLRACQAVEQAAHRTREVHWGPRTLDVDILTMLERSPEGQWRPIDSAGRWGDELILPHPYAHQRAFVLVPWSFLPDVTSRGPVPDAVFSVAGRPVGQWLDALRASNPEEVLGVREAGGRGWMRGDSALGRP